tara:strand:- start:71 stop:577 length:507 start_codon:yes stop_codon:yes gene_type:complete
MGKNIQKVQDMVDGNYKSKIQVGYNTSDERREVGDKWIDSDGNHWEQKEGYRTKNTNNVRHHSWDEKCSDCEKLIIKKWDKDTHKADGRCYYCQIDFEAELKSKPIRWFAYRRLKELINNESIRNDIEKYVFEMHEFRKNERIFDKSVANAMANDNVEMAINKNKAIK